MNEEPTGWDCPRCGEGIRSYGDGRKECTACPWSHEPPKPTKQVGLTNWKNDT